MTSYTYRHQVVRWNGTSQQAAKYQLQVISLGHAGQPIHRANWNFETFRGLLNFLKKHFPDSDLLNQTVISAVQFQVLSPAPES